MKKLAPLALTALCLFSPALHAAVANGTAKLVPTDFNSASSGELFLNVWDTVAEKSYSLDLGVTVEQFLADPAPRAWALGQRFRDLAAAGNPLRFNVAANNTYGTINAGPAGLAPAGYGILTSVLNQSAEKAKAESRTGTSGTQIQQMSSAIQGRVNAVNLNAVFQNYGGSPSGSPLMGVFSDNLGELTDAANDPFHSYFGGSWGTDLGGKVNFSTTATAGEQTLLLYFLGLEAPGSSKVLATQMGAAAGTTLSLNPGSATLAWGEGAVAANGCALPWGAILAHGQSVVAYRNNLDANCAGVAESRTCSDGSLSGSAGYPACSAPPQATACALPWGGTLASGQSVPAYRAATADDCGALVETRTCTNGSLSGSYGYAACTVDAPTGPFVRIVAPAGGQVLKVRKKAKVSWTFGFLNARARVNVDLLRPGAKPVALGRNLRITASVNFRPTRKQVSNSASIRVCVKGTSVCGTSAAPFSITP